ncbi:hypothetical protein ARMGADRAFT_1020799 [Armillaria gallica]|uniref:Uncharacterized protein n=1 Tax=Armillaria gallica TaxID=47427 RepID=A0A2H3CX59_ARMGA|nr:hypothetical protein ARMGADRAFT_1020799 [Armillaria gallica]
MTLHHPTMMHHRLSLRAASLVFLDSQIRGDDRDLQMTSSQQNEYQQHTTAKMETNTTAHVPVSTA